MLGVRHVQKIIIHIFFNLNMYSALQINWHFRSLGQQHARNHPLDMGREYGTASKIRSPAFTPKPNPYNSKTLNQVLEIEGLSFVWRPGDC